MDDSRDGKILPQASDDTTDGIKTLPFAVLQDHNLGESVNHGQARESENRDAAVRSHVGKRRIDILQRPAAVADCFRQKIFLWAIFVKAVERADSQDLVQEVVLRESGVDDLARPQLPTVLARGMDTAASGVVMQKF